MDTIAAADVSSSEMDVIADALKQLPDESSVAEMLACLLDTMRRGKDLAFGGVDTEVTPTEAARILHMSRPHLYKLLDDGAMPFTRVGTHRRLLLGDVLSFHVQQSANRKELAETLAHSDADREQFVADLAGIPAERRGNLLR